MSAVTSFPLVSLNVAGVSVTRVSDDFPDLGISGLDGLDDLFVEPRPDEDAWEAYLDLALERIGGERGPGLTNRELGELEAVVGVQLPFEVGMLLVMGVPVAEPWRQWHDPEAQWLQWNEYVRDGIAFDVEHNEFWADRWGQRPSSLADQLATVHEQFETTIPPLFPLYSHRAVPLTTSDGAANSDGNPVLSVHQTDVIVYGADLAAWMHREFEVPLPMWPSEDRTFTFWSDPS